MHSNEANIYAKNGKQILPRTFSCRLMSTFKHKMFLVDAFFHGTSNQGSLTFWCFPSPLGLDHESMTLTDVEQLRNLPIKTNKGQSRIWGAKAKTVTSHQEACKKGMVHSPIMTRHPVGRIFRPLDDDFPYL